MRIGKLDLPPRRSLLRRTPSISPTDAVLETPAPAELPPNVRQALLEVYQKYPDVPMPPRLS